MTDVHLKKNGEWERCRTGAATCTRRFHLQDLTVAEANALPKGMLWTLLEAIDPPFSSVDGNKIWLDVKADLHRDYDLPAVIQADGTLEWYRHGKPHRDGDKPASISPSVGLEWYQHGMRHRDNDLPAVINSNNGWFEWYQHGVLHRDKDLPAIMGENYQAWYRNDNPHRDNGEPAVIDSDGECQWWENGEWIRTEPGEGMR